MRMEFSKYKRDLWKSLRGHMDQLEQFRSGLLFRGIDILIALDDVDVDGQVIGMRRQRLVARGDLRIALRPEVPDGGGIFDQEREIVVIEQGQHTRGVGADEIAHAGIEAVVDMSEHEIEIGLGGADGFDFADPVFLLAARELGAVVEKSPQTRGVGIGRLKQLDRIEAIEAVNSSRTSWFMGVKRAGLAAPSSDSK